MVKKIKIGKVQINFSNRWLYTFIAIGILVVIGAGVYAWANPITGVGHSLDEIGLPDCVDGQILQMSGEDWVCENDEVGPSVPVGGLYGYCKSRDDVGLIFHPPAFRSSWLVCKCPSGYERVLIGTEPPIPPEVHPFEYYACYKNP